MLTLTGCTVIKSQFATQLNSIGNVQISTTFCTFKSAAPTTCTAGGNLPIASDNQTGQTLIGYRIPSAAGAPASFMSTDTTITMTQSPSYSAELQRLSPAPAGQKWVGYISQVTAVPAGTEKTATPQFTLARGADGSPFESPFLWRVVVGDRIVTASAPSTRPVVCGGTLDSNPTDGDTTVCVNSPTTADVATNITRTTRDLGIIPPAAPVSVERGQTGVVTFRAKQSGVSTGPTFTVTAETTLPGATAAPNVINYAPTPNQDAPISVLVNVPSGAAPGTYDVTLKATSGAGPTLQTRTGVAKLTVPAPASGGGVTNRINSRVRYRVSVGSRIRVLSMRVLGAPGGTRIVVSCRKGNCRLPLLNGSRTRTRTSQGRPVELAGIFSRLVLRPGVVIEIRMTRSGLVGKFFRFTFTRTAVRTLECELVGGTTRKCIRL
jgi:hypothetical protein